MANCLAIVGPDLVRAIFHRYCGKLTKVRCTLCHLPVCQQHRVRELGEWLCLGCWNGKLQMEGAENYTPREEDRGL